MLDTVHMNYRIDNASKAHLLMNEIKDVREHVSHETGQFAYTGHLDNLRVSLNGRGLSVKGSISKFFLGTNCTQLTRKGCEDAVEKLSDSFGVDFKFADVTRVDIASNLFVSNPVSCYLNLLGSAPYLTRLEQPSSLYIKNGSVEYLFYDKSKEQGKKAIPDSWQDKNVLRYEMRNKKGLKNKLGLKEIKGSDLFDEGVYQQMIQLWKQGYEQIDKISKITFEDFVLNSQTEIFNQLALIGVEVMGGESELLKLFEEAKGSGIFTSRQNYYRAKSKLKKITSNPMITTNDPLIEELNKKISFVSSNYQ